MNAETMPFLVFMVLRDDSECFRAFFFSKIGTSAILFVVIYFFSRFLFLLCRARGGGVTVVRCVPVCALGETYWAYWDASSFMFCFSRSSDGGTGAHLVLIFACCVPQTVELGRILFFFCSLRSSDGSFATWLDMLYGNVFDGRSCPYSGVQ